MTKRAMPFYTLNEGPYATYTAHDIRKVKLGEIKNEQKVN